MATAARGVTRMAKGGRRDDERTAAIVAAIREGHGGPVIAERFGIGRAWVCRIAKDHGLRVAGGRRRGAERAEALRRGFETGMEVSLAAVGKRVGINLPDAERLLEGMGHRGAILRNTLHVRQELRSMLDRHARREAAIASLWKVYLQDGAVPTSGRAKMGRKSGLPVTLYWPSIKTLFGGWKRFVYEANLANAPAARGGWQPQHRSKQ